MNVRIIGLSLLLIIFESFNNVINTESIQEIDDNSMALNELELKNLKFLWQEEKLARDIYSFYNITWNKETFAHIKQSEQTHMDAIKFIFNFYDMKFTNDLDEGEFTYSILEEYYLKFTKTGSTSLKQALLNSILFEEMDIYDLQQFINNTNNLLLLKIYKLLQCGSRNHLRAYMELLNKEYPNEVYVPTYLNKLEFDKITLGNYELCHWIN